jgi:hypothetical protein
VPCGRCDVVDWHDHARDRDYREVLRLTLLDQSGETRLSARVAWSTAETAGRQVRYRAGIEFIDPDPELIEVLCIRYGSGQAQFVS